MLRSILVGVVVIIAAVALVLAFFINYPKNTTVNITANTQFYGQKLARNYYAFSVLDYHRLLIQRKAHILFFCTDDLPACGEQDDIMKRVMKNTTTAVIVLSVNMHSSTNQDAVKELMQMFKVDRLVTLLAFEGDGNQLPTRIGLQNEIDFQKLLSQL